jgi:hypothetical protein
MAVSTSRPVQNEGILLDAVSPNLLGLGDEVNSSVLLTSRIGGFSHQFVERSPKRFSGVRTCPCSRSAERSAVRSPADDSIWLAGMEQMQEHMSRSGCIGGTFKRTKFGPRKWRTLSRTGLPFDQCAWRFHSTATGLSLSLLPSKQAQISNRQDADSRNDLLPNATAIGKSILNNLGRS